jgi:hypothetical protein
MTNLNARKLTMAAKVFICLLAILRAYSRNGQLAAPANVSFQGILNGPANKPLSDATHKLSFKFYDSQNPNATPLGVRDVPMFR